jgi:CheY-like chemotaxis protein
MSNELTYLIDDDSLTLRLTTMLAKRTSFCSSLLPFSNAKIALELLQKNAKNNPELPDCILLDLNMPKMNGWEFLDAMENLNITKDIYIFIMTSSIELADIEKSKKYFSVKDYIEKPISIEKLDAIKQFIVLSK